MEGFSQAKVFLVTDNKEHSSHRKRRRKTNGSESQQQSKVETTGNNNQTENNESRENMELSKNSGVGYSTIFSYAFAGVWVWSLILGATIRLRNRTKNKTIIRTKSEFEERTDSVPHGLFCATENGFTYRFYSTQMSFSTIPADITKEAGGEGAGVFLVFLFLAIYLFCVPFIFLFRSIFPAVIHVDNESIVVDGRRMRRIDFGFFKICRTKTVEDAKVAVLGYTFDNQSHTFGGYWDELEASEVVTALNRKLGIQGGDGPAI
jgi:hypothetical protein